MNKYAAEFIGTFFLVLTIGVSSGTLQPLAIGAILMTMIFAGGHVSGAHFNPAVTLAVWLRGKLPTLDIPGYMIAQVLGAVVAAIAVMFLTEGAAHTPAVIKIAPALVAELLFTFALAYVVLNVATAKANSNNSFYGLAIGFTVFAGAVTVGGISGGVFNPAVEVALLILKVHAVANCWVYLIADFGGAALAAIVFKMLNPNDS